MTRLSLNECIDLKAHPLDNDDYRQRCKQTLDAEGVLCLKGFLSKDAIAGVRAEGATQRHLAFFTDGGHNVYLAAEDPEFASDHPRNRQVS